MCDEVDSVELGDVAGAGKAPVVGSEQGALEGAEYDQSSTTRVRPHTDG
jgi:hypothetical protein